MVLVIMTRGGGGGGGGKKFVSASTREELLRKALQHFGIPNDEPYKLCVTSGEAEGLEVEDDDVLMELSDARKPELLGLVVMPQDGVWNPNYDSSSSSTNTPSNSSDSSQSPEGEDVPLTHSLATPNTPIVVRYPPLPMGPLLEIVQPILDQLKASPPPRNILLKKRSGTKEASKYCSEFIWRHVKNYSYSTCQSYATAIFSYGDGMLKPLFRRSYAELIEEWGFETFVSSVYNALNHRKSKVRLEAGETPRKRRTIRSPLSNRYDEESVDDPESALKRMKMDDLGCVRYNPGLEPGESASGQESKRLQLLAQPDDAVAVRLMQECYASVRSEIVHSSGIKQFPSILERWPLLSTYKGLLQHASHLLDKDVLGTFNKSLALHAKKTVLFLEQSWNNTPKTPSQVAKLLDATQEAVLAERGLAPYSEALMPLLLLYFKEDSDIFYQLLKFDSTESQILTAAEQANFNPTIIILGSSVFSPAGIKVVLFNKIVLEVPSLAEAALTVTLCFFVFGIKYPKETQTTLEYIQRTLLQVNPPTGSKRESSRRGIINPKLLRLAEQMATNVV